MYCKHCPTDGSRCSVCDGDDGHCDHEAANRKYSQRVAAVCLAGLVLMFAVAIVCAVVNGVPSAK